MIPIKQELFKVDSNFEGDIIPLSISRAGVEHIMSILTNLYSDPTAAVIREYSVNGRDSHIEAGNDAPIHVHTPNKMTPLFVVEDFGVGMSIDELQNVYCVYGESTKLTTNEQTGMLGLGSKSALAITQQFIIESIKNGVRASATISRTEEGGAVMQIIDTAATDKPNGVKISVPMAPSEEFNSKVDEFFKWWTPGTVLVNGKEPEHGLNEYEKISDVLYVQKNVKLDDFQSPSYRHLLVMGGVTYPVTNNGYTFDKLRVFNLKTVIVADIGAVSITPSREALNYDSKETTEVIDKAYLDIYDEMIKSIGRDIEKCETPVAAWKLAHSWRTKIGKAESFTYKGKEIPVDIEQKYILVFDYKSSNNRTIYTHIQNTIVPGPDEVMIVGCDNPGPFATGRINSWKTDNDMTLYRGTALLMGPGPVNEWLEGCDIRDYKDIKKAFKVNTANVRKTYYECSAGKDRYKQSTELSVVKEYKTVIYKLSSTPTLSTYDFPLDDKTIIVYLTENRLKKLLREVPHAISTREWFEQERDRLRAKISSTEREMVETNYIYSPPGGVEEKDFDDPEIKAWIRYHSYKKSPDGIQYEKVLQSLGERKTTHDNTLQRYPLADSYTMKREHTIWYMNKYYHEVLKH